LGKHVLSTTAPGSPPAKALTPGNRVNKAKTFRPVDVAFDFSWCRSIASGCRQDKEVIMLGYSDDEAEFEGLENHGSTTQGLRIPDSSHFTSSIYPRGNSVGSTGYAAPDLDLQRSRSASFSVRFREAGGVNSINNFARSWQRAAAFPEVIPRRSSFVAVDSDDDLATSPGVQPGRSSRVYSQDADLERPLLGPYGQTSDEHGPDDQGHSKKGFPASSILGSSFDRSLGASYGTISSRVSESARRHAIQFHREHQALADAPIDSDAEPLLVKQVQHEDGTRENIVIGQSTVPQTIFNSVNVLIGVGLLSLPLAMKQAGWLLGLLFLFFAAVTTSYTAKILAKCLDVDRSLVTYADLAYISFGHHARLVISLLFCLELVGACVALVVLFADSLHVLVPGLSIFQWKMICGAMLIPLNFVPLRFLSVTSILGILSCTSIVLLTFIDGLIKPDAPGSLLQPSRTYLFPDSWSTVPLSFGLIMCKSMFEIRIPEYLNC
jgi:vesicular inhibitory amino acid transporter